MRVLVNKTARTILCRGCGRPVEGGERYVHCTAGSFHLAHFRDAHGRPIVEPRTALEESRASIPVQRIGVSQR